MFRYTPRCGRRWPAMSSTWPAVEVGSSARLVRRAVGASECRGKRYVGLEHIGEGTLAITSAGDGDLVESAKSEFRAGDILFGKLRPYFRKVAIAPFDGVCSTDIWVVRPVRGVDPRFLFYRLASTEFVEAASRGAEGTRMPRAKWGFVSRLAFPLPPLAIQKRISHILGTLDDKIELSRRMNETLEAMARAIFKSWFVDFDPVHAKAAGRDTGLPRRIAGLFPSEFQSSELGLIPKGWKVVLLGELAELAYGSALPAEARRPGTVPVFGSNGQIGWHSDPNAQGPGIIVGRKGNPGVVTWSYTDFFAIDTAYYVVPRGGLGRSLHFLFHALREQGLASLGADSAVPGLNRNIAYTSKQVLPPHAVRAEFDESLAPLLSKAEKCRREMMNLALLRDTLLPKLLSGELPVPEAETIISEVT